MAATSWALLLNQLGRPCCMREAPTTEAKLCPRAASPVGTAEGRLSLGVGNGKPLCQPKWPIDILKERLSKGMLYTQEEDARGGSCIFPLATPGWVTEWHSSARGVTVLLLKN